jgi:hypothetical protein
MRKAAWVCDQVMELLQGQKWWFVCQEVFNDQIDFYVFVVDHFSDLVVGCRIVIWQQYVNE